MTNYFILIVMGLTVIAATINSLLLTVRVRQLESALWQVRIATVSLVNHLQDDIKDLQDSLKEAGIPLSRNHMNEYLRREALSAEERYDESLVRWQETVAKAEQFWDDPHAR